MKDIRAFARRVAAEFRPRKIILFGSHAQRRATKDSDVDLLIIVPSSGDRVRQAVAIQLELKPKFPVDLIVRSPQEVRRRLQMGDTFIRDILRDGIVLYEASHG
jgi:predicted nucleotidyltransferase